MTVPSAGFLLVDKPPEWTSHDVVAKVRNVARTKVGHAGTLDPMATGLLVLGLGRATKLMRYVQSGTKEYLASAQLGVATDSLDADGAVLSREPLPVGPDEVRAAMSRFTGEVLQVPPMVSARKVEGQRLYQLAREGKVVEREARTVIIDRLELIDVAPSDYPVITFRTVCSTGTYVRTLADDIARAMGGRAHLTALRRVRNGQLHVNDAVAVEDAVNLIRASRHREILLTPWDALEGMEALRVDDATAFRVRNGGRLDAPIDLVADGEPVRVAGPDGALAAVYRRAGAKLVPEVVVS